MILATGYFYSSITYICIISFIQLPDELTGIHLLAYCINFFIGREAVRIDPIRAFFIAGLHAEQRHPGLTASGYSYCSLTLSPGDELMRIALSPSGAVRSGAGGIPDGPQGSSHRGSSAGRIGKNALHSG